MNNILVTGGAGFIGSNFIRYLLKAEPSVRIYNLDAMTYSQCFDNLFDLFPLSRHKAIIGNITDASLVHRICKDSDIDTIVHFAAESHVDHSINNPEIFMQTNVMGTFVLIEAARKMDIRFHHISTDEVYGHLEPNEKAWIEGSKYGPRSPYSASKAASDHIVRAYGTTYGSRYTLSNSSNNYGPYQFDDKLIPITIGRALRSDPILIHGDGLQIRDWLHVEDHCEGIYTVLTKGKLRQTYNIGGGNQWTVVDIVKEICGIMDELIPKNAPHARLIQHIEDRTGQDRRYALNTKKIEALGWTRKHELIESLKETVRWYVDKS